MERINSLQNQWVKQACLLKQKKYRTREQLFLLEGIRLIEEAFASSWPLRSIFYSEKLLQTARGERLLQSCSKEQARLFYCSDAILEKLAGTENNQGIVAVGEQKQYGWDKVLQKQKDLLLVLVDGVQDPGNLGTIIRTADAAAASAVLLSKGTVDLYSEKTVRSTMGALFHIPIFILEDLAETIELLQANDVCLVAGDLAGNAYCFQADLTGSVAICLGNEGAGIGDLVREKADLLVKIPMPGRAESFNVGVASGIFLYEVNRQRLAVT